ncbi:hypothetical protein RRF57_009462 [Xylaria bambusicola]|uniref:Beta-ketoacyl synthase-like N-terminal domain-containing protein n=1 Tax=Xylaria bambusicola TaxID=326684 RepID=A0AAN7UQ01_9PEZI
MPFEPIAIIGSGCRLPGGADTPSKLWDILKSPSDLRREIPKDRFNVDRYYHPDNSHHGTSNIRHSYVLEDDYRNFDANFFGVKTVEASASTSPGRFRTSLFLHAPQTSAGNLLSGNY